MTKSAKRMLFACVSDYMCNSRRVIDGNKIASISNNLNCTKSMTSFVQRLLTYKFHSLPSPLSCILHITADVEDTLSF